MIQVTDLEISKKLQPYMVDVEESFIWNWHDNDGQYVLEYKDVSGYGGHRYEEGCFSWYPAYILDDLLDVLPKVRAVRSYVDSGGEKSERELLFTWVMTDFGQDIEYINFPGYNKLDFGSYQGYNSIGAHNVNRVTAAAKLLLWLADNGYLPIKDTIKE